MKKRFLFAVLLTILMGLLPSMMAYAQTYTVSPSGYTSVPSSNVTHGSRTLHGNLLQVKATVSGKVATFTLKKNDGSKFQNSGSIFVRKDTYSGSNVQSSVQYNGGIYNPTVDVDLDFTSGSKTYVIVISSKGTETIYYYSNPITIKASSSTLATPDNTKFYATNITTTGFTANWSSVSGATQYYILVKKASDSDYSNPVFDGGSKGTSCSITGLQPGTSYQFQVRAVNSSSQSNWSKSIQNPITTLSETTLATPDNTKFYATNITTTGFTANWSSVSGATQYYILVKKASDSDYSNPVFDGSSKGTSCSITGLQPGTSYQFQVRAVNSSGKSNWSKSIQNPITTLSETTLATPDNTKFYATNITTTGFTANWSAVSGATQYYILVKKASDSDYSNPVFDGGSKGTSCSITGLQPGTSYQFQVRAVNSSGQSNWSKSIQSPITTSTSTNPPTTSDKYIVSPSGYTSVPTSNLKQGSVTFHGNLLQAKATVSGSKATFTLRKNDGSAFQNSGTYVIRYDSYSGTAAKTNIRIEAGSTNPSTDLDLDFTSGSKKYVITLKSGDIYYYTNPITITASSSSPSTQTANLVLASSLSFSTPSQTVSSMAKGQTYTFSVRVKNTGSTAWKGAFYLKNGSEVLLSWGGQSIASGSTITLTDTYKSRTTGNMTLDLFYQTGGKGSGILVNSGNYQNPLTISVAASLATPDKSTFKATNVGETEFTANWGSVQGADCYDILVKRASDEDYSYYVFKRATSRTNITVTDLEPNTSYQFQIRARNSNNGNSSNWSSSIPTAVKTKSSAGTTTTANLSILSVQGIDGSTPLTVGKVEHYSVLVVNNGTSRWNGSLYLKDGKNNVKGWYSISLPSGVAQRFECDYIPDVKGSKSLVLYYQTGGRGDGVPVNAGKAKNPMAISVISDPTINNELTLKSVITYPQTFELGKKGTVTAQVLNSGDTDWYGTIYLTDNNAAIASEVNLLAGQSKTISTTAWEPTTTGSHSIAVYYESKNSSNKQLVSANGFSNPVYSYVSRKQNNIVGNTVKLKNLTKEVAPQFVTEGSEVYHHYKVTDMNDNPMKGITAVFSTISGNPIKVKSNESDDDGILTLCLKTEGTETVASPGASIIFSCIDLIKNDGQHFDIYSPNSNEHNVSLTVLKKSHFENAEKVNLSIDLGLSAKAELTNYLKGKASVSVPLKFGWQFNEDNTFSNYILGIGIKGEVGCTAKLGNTLLKLKGVEVTGKAGIGYESSYQSKEFKPAIWALVYNICNSLPPTTDWLVKYGADVYKAWYEESDIEKPNFTQNGFVNPKIRNYHPIHD